MDLLSHVLKTARARSPFIGDIRLGKDVSLGIPRVAGIPFHYLVRGNCRLTFEAQSVDLAAGDFVMLPRRPAYRLESGSGKNRVEILDFEERENLPHDYMRVGVDRPLVAEVGGPSLAVRLLSGRVTPVGPEVTLLRDAKAQLEPWLVAAIEFVSAEGSVP